MRLSDAITGISVSLIGGLTIMGIIVMAVGALGLLFFDEDINEYKIIQLIYIILFVYIGMGLNHTLINVDGKIFPKEVEYVNTIEEVENSVNSYIVNGELVEDINVFTFPELYKDLGNFIVYGEKYADTFMYGQTYNKMSGYKALVISDDTISTFNNDHICEVSVECAQTIKELYETPKYTDSVDDSSEHLYTSDLLINNYDSEIKELENKVEGVESKIVSIENKINELEDKVNQDKGIEKAGLFDFIKILVIIWFISITSYVIITRNNLKIKRDLINTSSEAKIREGVMLDKNN